MLRSRSTAPSTPTWPGSSGTIFGIRPGPGPHEPDPGRALLGAGTRQIAAGYILYGPATVFVYAAGGRVHVFVLDPADGRFRLTRGRRAHAARRADLRGQRRELAALAPGSPRARREAAGGPPPGASPTPSGTPGALVADFHRTLVEGGIYLYPRGRAAGPKDASGSCTKPPRSHWWPRRPAARASTGRARILDVVATDYHQRTPIYIGSTEEVTWAERAYQDAGG